MESRRNFTGSRARQANHPKSVKPLREKYSDFQKARITAISFAVLFPQEGRFAVVTDVGSGMRWTRRLMRAKACGRMMLKRTAKTCGP